MTWYFFFFALNIFHPTHQPLQGQLGPFATAEACETAKAELLTGLSKFAGAGWQAWVVPVNEGCWSARR